jgi:hypothetical protein
MPLCRINGFTDIGLRTKCLKTKGWHTIGPH